jgi:hypothetical protein
MPSTSIETGSPCISRLRRGACLAAALALTGCAHPGKTPQPAAPAAAATQPAAAPENAPHPVLDTKALDLLKRMGETLASAKSYSYRSQGSAEVPASTGQFLTFFANNQITLERPNKLRAQVGGDVPGFQITYDGSKVWAYDPAKNLYATADAPATIDETLKLLMDKAGIHFPAADLLVNDPYAAMSKGVTSAFLAGQTLVDGHPCDHLALMGPGVNWEIWIDSGATAVPRRLAITYKETANFPRYRVDFYDWKLNPKLPASQFAFKPPKDAKQTSFESEVGQEFEAPKEGAK